jgi:hypothetical protein
MLKLIDYLVHRIDSEWNQIESSVLLINKKLKIWN